MDITLGTPWGRVIEVLAVGFMLFVCWGERRQSAREEAFSFSVSLVLAVTVLVVPSFGPYNQVLLLPAFLIMLRERAPIWQRSFSARWMLLIVGVLLVWQWFWCTVLAGLSFILPLQMLVRFHQVPLWTVLLTPFAITGAMLIYGKQRIFAASGNAGKS
jgi:hypothetical protein